MSERDIYAAALILQSEFGKDAAKIAAERADKRLCRGDTTGAERWERVRNAIRHMELSASHTVH